MLQAVTWRRLRRWGFIGLLVSVALFAGAAWYIAGQLVAPANHNVGSPPSKLLVESVSFPSDSGGLLSGWYIPATDATATVVLLHPIRSDRRAMLTRAKFLHDAGYSTLLVDLQAHGESPGENITAGYRERLDVTAAVNYIHTRSPTHKVGVIGWSLGGAAALLAAPLKIDALVLEAVYPTISGAVHNRVAMRFGPLHHLLAPALLVQFEPRLGVSPEQLRPIEFIASIGCPVLVATGDADEHTTLAETKQLFQTAVEPKRLVVFAGAGHGDLLTHDPAKYQNEILAFLKGYLN